MPGSEGFGFLACMRYAMAIMLPKIDEEVANLLAPSLLHVVAGALTVPAFRGEERIVLPRAPGPYLVLRFGFVGRDFLR